MALMNVILLGVAFMLIMAAFQTSSFFQTSVLTDQGYGDLGFYSLGIIYGVFAAANFIAPHVVTLIGPKFCMMLGGSMYCCLLVSLIHVNEAGFLVASAINGLGAALIWTAQGAAITLSSTDETRGRDSGIFWGITQLSLAAGAVSALAILSPRGDNISKKTASRLYIILTCLCGTGSLVFLLLRNLNRRDLNKTSSTALANQLDRPVEGSEASVLLHSSVSPQRNPCRAIGSSVLSTMKMFTRRNMLCICVIIVYSGLELAFWQGQYPLIIGNKEDRVDLPSSFKPQTVGYLMIVFCVSEFLGSVGFGKLSDLIGRFPVVVIGGLLHLAAFGCIYWVLFLQTITPTPTVGYIAGFLLGLGDSVYNTQVFSALGDLFPSGRLSADAFAANYVAKALASMCAFYYAPHLNIDRQLLVLIIFLAIGTPLFYVVERQLKVLKIQAEEDKQTLSEQQEQLVPSSEA